ncbi:MAG: hypothetical protein E7270_09180 [Lachnospiraceae bacterium]|nr:hypothetical protein [Lachnospiraceae bacterium]
MALRNHDSTKPIINNKKYGFDTINKGFFKRNDEKRNDEQYRLSAVRGLVLTSLFVFYLEVLTGLVCGGIKPVNMLYYFLTAGVVSAAISVISCIFKNRVVNYIISCVTKLFICFIYVGQVIYYEANGMFSDRFLSVIYMDGKDVINALANKWWCVLLMLLPLAISVVIFVVFNRIDEDILGYSRRTVISYIFTILIGILAFTLFELSVQLMDTDNAPVFSIYLEENNHNEYIENFGISSYIIRDLLKYKY